VGGTRERVVWGTKKHISYDPPYSPFKRSNHFSRMLPQREGEENEKRKGGKSELTPWAGYRLTMVSLVKQLQLSANAPLSRDGTAGGTPRQRMEG